MPPNPEQVAGRPAPGAPSPPLGQLGPAPGGAVPRAPTPRRAEPGDGAGTEEGATSWFRPWWPGIRATLRTTLARVWLLTLLCVATIVGLFGSASITLDQARESLDVLGRDAGPRAMATTELYLALADMDARVADVLLMGDDHGLGSGRDEAISGYEESRGQANEALLQAASLTEGDTVEEHNVQAVLDGMGAYDQLAAEARSLNDEAGAPAGEVDEAALVTYRQATLLMHTELLPKAFNLGLDSSAIVRTNHEQGQSSVALGLVWVSAAGVAAVAAFIGLQFYLRVRFRRRFNAPLLVATAGTVLLTLGVVLVLNSSGTHQGEAKGEGLDAAMALARAGAITTDMQADQSRYLIDDVFSDNYQQVYLERSQQVLFRPANTLEDYYTAIGEIPGAFPTLPGSDGAVPKDPGTLGYLGQSAQDALLPGQEGALAEVLSAYNDLQVQDQRLRSAAEAGDLDEAIDVRMGVAHTEEGVFSSYMSALDELIDLHREEFSAGIERGDAVLAPWTWVLPAGALLLLALVVAGVRPRIAEYR